MSSTPQKLIESTPRPSFGIISRPIDLKKETNPTPPSESPENLQNLLKIKKHIANVGGTSFLTAGIVDKSTK